MVPPKHAGGPCCPICFRKGDIRAAFMELESHIWSLAAANFMHTSHVGTGILRWRVTNNNFVPSVEAAVEVVDENVYHSMAMSTFCDYSS